MQQGNFTDKKQVKLYLSEDACTALDAAAARTGLSKSVIVDTMLRGGATGNVTIRFEQETGSK